MNRFPTAVEYWSLPDGSTVTVTITVDEAQIHGLVMRAYRNQRRRTQAGPVVVKLSNLRPAVLPEGVRR